MSAGSVAGKKKKSVALLWLVDESSKSMSHAVNLWVEGRAVSHYSLDVAEEVEEEVEEAEEEWEEEEEEETSGRQRKTREAGRETTWWF